MDLLVRDNLIDPTYYDDTISDPQDPVLVPDPVNPINPYPIDPPYDPKPIAYSSAVTDDPMDYSIMSSPRYYINESKWFNIYKYRNSISWIYLRSYKRGNHNVLVYNASHNKDIKALRKIRLTAGTGIDVAAGVVAGVIGAGLTLAALASILISLNVVIIAGAIRYTIEPSIKVNRVWTLEKYVVGLGITLAVEKWHDYSVTLWNGKVNRKLVQSGGSNNWYSNRWMTQKADVAYQEWRYINHYRNTKPYCKEFSWCN
ncbi:hypothetical protein [Bacillus sp. FJAT-45066]|uniref:hypothetical protein n=1 Tax=Bacillus sp. FJAT-45066 TaxID=2011010 RepID=UPI000BB766CA|nr:hypothetical protein [Bacillus sp. FJAT-45066]